MAFECCNKMSASCQQTRLGQWLAQHVWKRIKASRLMILIWCGWEFTSGLLWTVIFCLMRNIGQAAKPRFPVWVPPLLCIGRMGFSGYGFVGAWKRDPAICRNYFVCMWGQIALIITVTILVSRLECACEGKFTRKSDGSVKMDEIARNPAGYYQCEALRDFGMIKGERFVNFFPEAEVINTKPMLEEMEAQAKGEEEKTAQELLEFRQKMQAKKELSFKQKARAAWSKKAEDREKRREKMTAAQHAKDEKIANRMLKELNAREQKQREAEAELKKQDGLLNSLPGVAVIEAAHHVKGLTLLESSRQQIQADGEAEAEKPPSAFAAVEQRSDTASAFAVVEMLGNEKIKFKPEGPRNEQVDADEDQEIPGENAKNEVAQNASDDEALLALTQRNDEAIVQHLISSRGYSEEQAASSLKSNFVEVEAELEKALATDDNKTTKAWEYPELFLKRRMVVGQDHALCLQERCHKAIVCTDKEENETDPDIDPKCQVKKGEYCSDWSIGDGVTHPWCFIRKNSVCHSSPEDIELRKTEASATAYRSYFDLDENLEEIENKTTYLVKSTVRCSLEFEKERARRNHSRHYCRTFVRASDLAFVVNMLLTLYFACVVYRFVQHTCSDEIKLEEDYAVEEGFDSFSDIEDEDESAFDVEDGGPTDQKTTRKKSKKKAAKPHPDEDDFPVEDELEETKKTHKKDKKKKKPKAASDDDGDEFPLDDDEEFPLDDDDDFPIDDDVPAGKKKKKKAKK